MLPKNALVSIVHPLEMTEAQRVAWSRILADYETLPAFVQLGRSVFALTDKEKKADNLAPRFKGQEWVPSEAAFQSFWDDVPGPGDAGLEDDYAAMFSAVAKQFASEPYVLGYSTRPA